MSDRDLLSVIVPVYNGQGYIRRCIDSICRASGKLTDADVEIIVIDDGSTDDTAMILKALCREDDRIRVINLPDLGVSAARNRGIEEAKGQYLTFIDADDVIDEDMLKILYEALKDKNAGFAGCRFFSFSDEDVKGDGVTLRDNTSKSNKTDITEYTSSAYIREEILKGNSRCWSKLYRREAIGDIRFREGLTIGEDMLFVTMIAKEHDLLELPNYRGYGYYRNEKGAMNRPFTRSYMDQIRCWEYMEEELSGSDPEIRTLIRKNLVMGIMLTASKIALLPAKERRQQEECLKICHTKLRKALDRQVYAILDRGYRVKTRIFGLSPKLYGVLYHTWKH